MEALAPKDEADAEPTPFLQKAAMDPACSPAGAAEILRVLMETPLTYEILCKVSIGVRIKRWSLNHISCRSWKAW